MRLAVRVRIGEDRLADAVGVAVLAVGAVLEFENGCFRRARMETGATRHLKMMSMKLGSLMAYY